TANATGIKIDGTSSGTYQGNTISGNTVCGIVISYNGTNCPVFTGNTYSNNASNDLSLSGKISTHVNWTENVDLVYTISSLSIAEGASLNIASGITVRFSSIGSIGRLTVNGTLAAKGVTFTWADGKNRWDGLYFNGSGSSGSKLENCIIEYTAFAGCDYQQCYGYSAIEINNSSPTITGCTIRNGSDNYGISINGGSPVISNNAISGFTHYPDNDGIGLLVSNNALPIVTGNSITANATGIKIDGTSSGTYQRNTIKGNSTHGLYYSGTPVIDATNCDWGDPSGPLDDSDDRATGGLYNPNGKGNKVSDHVNYNPWGISAQLALSVSPASRSVAKAAGTTTFSVANTGTGTMPWTAAVTSGGSWLSITTGSSGSNSGTISCSFTANAGISVRTASIRVTATGATNSPQDVTVTQVVSSAGSLAASFAGSGLWVYNSDSATWTQISSINPENMIYSGSTLYADFGALGLWMWDGAAWSQLTSADPENMETAGSTLYVDFGASYGLYKWDGDSSAHLTSADPENMVTAGSTLYVDFGASYGLYKWDGDSWSQITPADPENMVTGGSALYVDFGASHGLYKWDSDSWSQLTPADPENIVTSDSSLYVDFGASYGLYKWDGAAWSQLTSANPENMVTAGSTLYVDFGASYGLYKWDGAAWSQ
ncbi:MAG: right-handed parallel beta-helix repeat-containing protein, partial [Deltaproteobacteria bacterium]